jgi:hypothetical protein
MARKLIRSCSLPGVHDVRPPSVALDASTSWSSANCHLPRSFEIEGFTLLFTGAGCPVMVLEAGLAETGPADDLRTLEPLIATHHPSYSTISNPLQKIQLRTTIYGGHAFHIRGSGTAR